MDDSDHNMDSGSYRSGISRDTAASTSTATSASDSVEIDMDSAGGSSSFASSTASTTAATSAPMSLPPMNNAAAGGGGGRGLEAPQNENEQFSFPSAQPPASAAPGLRYHKLEKLGEGTYGVVYKALDTKENRLVALKKVEMDAWEDGVPPVAIREISVLKEVDHANVVRLLDVFVTYAGNLYIVFELAATDMKKVFDANRRPYPLPELKRHLKELLRGIHACHVHRIIHRDMKPQNVLVTSDGTYKIADFGLARAFSMPLREYTHEVITLWYRAPEILLGAKTYSTAVDMWSVGVIFGEMALGRPFLPGDSEIDQLFKMFQIFGTPTEAEWPGVTSLPDYNPVFPRWKPYGLNRIFSNLGEQGVDLLKRMLTYDPSRRITAYEALRHPFLAEQD